MLLETPDKHYDIVVVGGGLVGASFALAMQRTLTRPLSLLIVEAVAQDSAVAQQPSFDARSTALSYGSRLIFERMSLWGQLETAANPIAEIQVSDKGRFGGTRLHHSEYRVDALGYVIENARMGEVLMQALIESSGIALLAPGRITQAKAVAAGMELTVAAGGVETQLTTGLVVLADGGRSPICRQLGIRHSEEEYGQQAIISNVAFERPHRNVAFERFTESGPLAVLPLPDYEGQPTGSLVWTVKDAQCEATMAMSATQFLLALQQQFGDRLGNFLRVGQRFSYPLRLSQAQEQIRPGLVLLGNVAHTLHPVAGQGLNLALRDIDALGQVLATAVEAGESPGHMPVLQRYLEAQRADQERSILFTDALTRLFSSNATRKVISRRLGLVSLSLLPSLKRGLAHRAMGLK